MFQLDKKLELLLSLNTALEDLGDDAMEYYHLAHEQM